MRDIHKANTVVANAYRPRPYDHPAVLIQVEGRDRRVQLPR